MAQSVMGELLRHVLALSGWPVYAVVLTLAFLESAAFVGLLLPGESALLVAGMLAARGKVSLALLAPLAAAAAIGGDLTGYLVGRHFGPRLRHTRLGRRVRPAVWDRAEDVVARRGLLAVIGGRWVGVLRALVPTVAGMTGMPWRRFLLANVVGGCAWAGTVVALGYFAGGSLEHVQRLLGNVSLLVSGVLLVLVGVVLVRLVRRRRREAVAHGTGPEPWSKRASAVRDLLGRVARGAGAYVVVLGVVCAAMVVVLADSARERDDLALLDPLVSARVAGLRAPDLTVAADFLTAIGSEGTLLVLTGLVAASACRVARSWRPGLWVVATMGGAAALTLAVKVVVARPRPELRWVLGAPESGYAFPSGHTLNSTVFFGMVAGFVLVWTRNRLLRLSVIVLAVGLSAGVGLSRVYLGYHWPTDVLAAWSLGVSWLAAVWCMRLVARGEWAAAAVAGWPGWRPTVNRLPHD